MAKQKRNSRSYKTTDEIYIKAMKRAKKSKDKLASVVEEVVDAYADGALTVHFKIK